MRQYSGLAALASVKDQYVRHALQVIDKFLRQISIQAGALGSGQPGVPGGPGPIPEDINQVDEFEPVNDSTEGLLGFGRYETALDARALRVDEVGNLILASYGTFEAQHVTLVASTDTTITFTAEVRLIRVVNWSVTNRLLVKDGAITSDTDSAATQVGKAGAINIPSVRVLPFKTTTVHLRAAAANVVTLEGYR